jgi:hypothetical protein
LLLFLATAPFCCSLNLNEKETMSELGNSTTIDEAIATCDTQIVEHRRRASHILQALWFGFLILFAGAVAFSLILYRPQMGASVPDEKAISALLSSPLVLAILAIFIVVFGVLMSVYRFHLNEVAKAEHYKLGFMRIRIAAHNTALGYKTEVRAALTDQAFGFQPATLLFKSKSVESPLPGHPTSDAVALILDKILAKFDLVEKKK